MRCEGRLFLTGAPGRFVCDCGYSGHQSELKRDAEGLLYHDGTPDALSEARSIN